MKIIFTFLIFFQTNFFLSQEIELRNCNVKYQIDTTELNKSGQFKLRITNLESFKIKIPQNYSDMRIQAQNAEKNDLVLNKFIKTKNTFVDVNCTDCNKKFFKLKPHEKFVYNFEINKLYLVEKILREQKTEYKFNLLFDNIDFKYKQNNKCAIENYESPKIIYKTK